MKRSLASTALLLFAFGCGVDSHVGQVYLEQSGQSHYTPPTPIFRDVTIRVESDHISMDRLEGDAEIDSLTVALTGLHLDGEEIDELYVADDTGIALDLTSSGQEALSVDIPQEEDTVAILVEVENLALAGSFVDEGLVYYYDVEMAEPIEVEVPFPEEEIEAMGEIVITICTSCGLSETIPVLQELIASGEILPGEVIAVDNDASDEMSQKVKEKLGGGLKKGAKAKIKKEKDDDEDEEDAEDEDGEDGQDEAADDAEKDKGGDKDKGSSTGSSNSDGDNSGSTTGNSGNSGGTATGSGSGSQSGKTEQDSSKDNSAKDKESGKMGKEDGSGDDKKTGDTSTTTTPASTSGSSSSGASSGTDSSGGTTSTTTTTSITTSTTTSSGSGDSTSSQSTDSSSDTSKGGGGKSGGGGGSPSGSGGSSDGGKGGKGGGKGS